jgi:hypothetical protein
MSIQIKYNRHVKNVQYARLRAMPSICNLREAGDKIHALAKNICEEKGWALPSANIIGEVAGVFYSSYVCRDAMRILELTNEEIAELAHVSASSCKAVLRIFRELKIMKSVTRFGAAVVDKISRVIKRSSQRSLTSLGMELFGLLKVKLKREAVQAEYEKKQKEYEEKRKNQKYIQKKAASVPLKSTSTPSHPYEIFVMPPKEE